MEKKNRKKVLQKWEPIEGGNFMQEVLVVQMEDVFLSTLPNMSYWAENFLPSHCFNSTLSCLHIIFSTSQRIKKKKKAFEF